MQLLLEEYYRIDLHIDRFHFRKAFIEQNKSYQINGITQSGKTTLVKNYLLGLKKNSYLYIDCNDIRIDITIFNKELQSFCLKNNITTLVLDNYIKEIDIITVEQLIIISETHLSFDFLTTITLYPLDYEEFLAYEHKYDSSALSHFFQLGGLPAMHKINTDMRNLYIQNILKNSLSTIEFHILVFCVKMVGQKVSPYSIYERLKQNTKVSKNTLYLSFNTLLEKNYLHQLSKFQHPKAVKKLYLCDSSLKTALQFEKNFGRVFENMIFLELLKSNIECFYEDKIDFFLPQYDEIILSIPFADERILFKKIEAIESFIFSYQIKKITAITMNREGSISHPISKVELVPFDIWAIRDS